MIETNKNNFFRKRESDFKKRILMKINVSKTMLKNDQRVCMVKQVEPKKLYGFSKMPESNPLAMQTFICTLLSEICGSDFLQSRLKMLLKISEAVVIKNYWNSPVPMSSNYKDVFQKAHCHCISHVILKFDQID